MNYEATQMYIDNCSSETDLVAIIDCNLLFDNHIDIAVKKVNQTIGMCKRTFTFLSKNVLIYQYKALVRPHLEYGNVIWYPCPKMKMKMKMRDF